MILTIFAFLYLFSFSLRFENKMFVQIRKLLKCYYLCSILKVFTIYFTYHMKFFDTKILFKKKFFHNKMGTKLLKTTNMLFSRTVIFDNTNNDKQQHQIAKYMIIEQCYINGYINVNILHHISFFLENLINRFRNSNKLILVCLMIRD